MGGQRPCKEPFPFASALQGSWSLWLSRFSLSREIFTPLARRIRGPAVEGRAGKSNLALVMATICITSCPGAPWDLMVQDAGLLHEIHKELLEVGMAGAWVSRERVPQRLPPTPPPQGLPRAEEAENQGTNIQENNDALCSNPSGGMGPCKDDMENAGRKVFLPLSSH